MAILTTSGRTGLALAVKSQALHIAWGRGDPALDDAWDAWLADPSLNPKPAPTPGVSALTDEIGRRTVSYTAFCYPDPSGDIIVPTGRFMTSAEPTNHLFIRADFDNTDGDGEIIRELALFVGTKVVSGLPPGQMYFLPEELEDPGFLTLSEWIFRTPRTNTVRPSFGFVLTL